MFKPRRFQFCPDCGGPTAYRIPSEDNRERAICERCGAVHYENPINVVGTLPVWGDGEDVQVLLCKRAIEPRYGLWTLPAGFLELGETAAEGALRETQEEAGAEVQMQPLYCLLNVVKVGQIHLFYRARLLSPNFAPGPETLEARLFREHEIPWEQLAFRTVRECLQRFFEDRRLARPFDLHEADII